MLLFVTQRKKLENELPVNIPVEIFSSFGISFPPLSIRSPDCNKKLFMFRHLLSPLRPSAPPIETTNDQNVSLAFRMIENAKACELS